jgi:hypothetical protein
MYPTFSDNDSVGRTVPFGVKGLTPLETVGILEALGCTRTVIYVNRPPTGALMVPDRLSIAKSKGNQVVYTKLLLPYTNV